MLYTILCRQNVRPWSSLGVKLLWFVGICTVYCSSIALSLDDAPVLDAGGAFSVVAVATLV